MKLLKYILIIAILASTNFIHAQNRSSVPQVDESKEAEVAQKVKKKLYPGGKDETELKVQPALSKPIRKITPTVEETPEREAEHD